MLKKLRLRFLLIAALAFAGSALPHAAFAADTVIFLTSGTTWSVPSDWNSSANTIEVIGGGARGGGGGGYAKATNVSLTPGGSVGYTAGALMATSSGSHAGNDTFFCNDTANCASISGTAVKVGAKGGGVSSGGAAASAVGGAGGGTTNPGAPYAYSGGNGTGGGGGAAGPNGAGGNNSGATGGAGGNGFGGAAGAGLGPGGNGTEWDATHGSGGGSGGTNGNTAAGGLYGGGSGVSGFSNSGAGAPGLIVITYTPVAASDTWNPTDLASGMVLSNGNLTASFGLTAGGYRQVRSTTSKSSGKWYYEVNVDSYIDGVFQIGIANSSYSYTTTNYLGSDANGIGYNGGGGIFKSGASQGSPSASSYTTNDVIGVAVDVDAGKAYFAKNNTWQSGTDPNAGTGGIALPSGAIFAALALSGSTGSGQTVTARFLAASQTYSPPTGYTAWASTGGGGGGSTPAPKFKILGGFFRMQGGSIRIQ